MKKTLMLLLLCAPLALFAQTKGKDRAATKEKTTETKETEEKPITKEEYNAQQEAEREQRGELRNNDNIYVEIVVSAGASSPTIKLVLGNYKDVCKDKSLSAGLEQARGIRYTSVAEVMNNLDALGFSVVATYEVPSRGSTETHLVLMGANAEPDVSVPVRGVGNTMSRENPAFNTKDK